MIFVLINCYIITWSTWFNCSFPLDCYFCQQKLIEQWSLRYKNQSTFINFEMIFCGLKEYTDKHYIYCCLFYKEIRDRLLWDSRTKKTVLRLVCFKYPIILQIHLQTPTFLLYYIPEFGDNNTTTVFFFSTILF